MTVTCPNGHASATDDFCDVCGAPITDPVGTPVPEAPADAGSTAADPDPAAAPSTGTGAGAPAPGASGLDLDPPSSQGSAEAPATESAAEAPGPAACPNCGAQNPVDALFCESCGYDFATGQLPPPSSTSIDPLSGQLVSPTGEDPAATGGPTALLGVEWVAEIWVDPDWFTSQQADGTCPTSGLPAIVPLVATTAAVGRRSKSRGLDPEIDVSGDGAISHRHAELTRTGERWAVTDLGSTNGTFVGKPDGTYPSVPIPPNEPRELDDDDRVYLGAWTRLVVRRATEQERTGEPPT